MNMIKLMRGKVNKRNKLYREGNWYAFASLAYMALRHCASVPSDDKSNDLIFIDEATVELRIRAYKHWYKYFPIEISRGKVGKFE